MSQPLTDATLLTCVPNFAVGRDRALSTILVAALRAAACARSDVAVLDCSSDPDHNRTVVTLAGSGPGLLAVLRAGALLLAEHADLRTHEGEHPLVGIVDVVPFVARSPASTPLAIAVARDAAQLFWAEIGIPSFLYGFAATRPARESLPTIRSEVHGRLGGNARALPDIGGPGFHLRLGAAVVGARRPLVALNVRLATQDVGVAREIARAVRERDGGLSGVRALGLTLASRGQVQISMNLIDLEKTAVGAALTAVDRLAADYNVKVAGRELIGLAPQSALGGVDQEHLECPGSSGQASLEVALRDAGRLSTDCG